LAFYTVQIYPPARVPPLYVQQRGIIDTVTGLLPLLIPSGLAVAAITTGALARSGR